MSKFASFLGKRVEVSYRAGEIHMNAIGTLVVDSGQSIRVEDRFEQSGREKTVRVEIPYPVIVRVREIIVQREKQPLPVS
ncbi:MAG TPA: hypothetical protein VGR81_04775 [Candidatus Acidoferrales bacterium]|nr:hypothetical protein [Candidatus Acidoferrales bacterium]